MPALVGRVAEARWRQDLWGGEGWLMRHVRARGPAAARQRHFHLHVMATVLFGARRRETRDHAGLPI